VSSVALGTAKSLKSKGEGSIDGRLKDVSSCECVCRQSGRIIGKPNVCNVVGSTHDFLLWTTTTYRLSSVTGQVRPAVEAMLLLEHVSGVSGGSLPWCSR
jgi:hypothetical protein